MSFIAPNSTIKILKNCPLDNGYNHTIYFEKEAKQSQYFESLTKRTFTDYTYIKESKKIRVKAVADSLFDCNYLMYKNTAFTDKWFYAFILDIEYINNNVAEISFEIDIMQTWYFDYKLKQCFVEREHTVTDGIGENIIEENLNIGDYNTSNIETPFSSTDYAIVFGGTKAFDSDSRNDITGGFIDGVFSGVKMFAVDNKYPKTLATLMNEWSADGSIEAITSVFMYPKELLDIEGEWENGTNIVHKVKDTKYVDFHRNVKDVRKISGYDNVKNNKLLTYPYCFETVSNNVGGEAIIKYEYFLTNTYRIYGSALENSGLKIVPKYYKLDLLTNNNLQNFEYGVTSPNIMCTWNADIYKIWLAQNQHTQDLSLLMGGGKIATGLVSSVGMGLTVGPMGVVHGVSTMMSGAEQIGSVIAQAKDMEVQPPQARGNQSTTINFKCGVPSFTIATKSIVPQYAKIIDDYFSMYGYAIRQVKTPTVNNRPYWTYVKTIGCIIAPEVGLPSSVMKQICSIYDKGITFWKNGKNIGDYSLDNRPS